jgi:hypothetical protein
MTSSHGRFIAYAASWTLAYSADRPGDRVTQTLCALFKNILAGLTQAGIPMIGHIKTLASAGEAGHVALSLTRYDKRCDRRANSTSRSNRRS